MFSDWWARWKTWREDRAVARRPIRDDLWKRTLVRYPFLRRRDAADQARLRRLTSLFLDRKEFSALGGVKLTDDVVVAVAAQACLPVLRMGLDAYDGFLGVVLHPDQVLAPRSFTDDDGVVHEYEEPLAGEAVLGGPVMLSWRDVRTAGRSTALGYNVVIHEFAHVLDMADGQADGVPPLPTGLPAREWQAVLSQAYEAFVAQVEAWEALPDEQALQMLQDQRGLAFDPTLVDLIVEHAETLIELRERINREPPSFEDLVEATD